MLWRPRCSLCEIRRQECFGTGSLQVKRTGHLGGVGFIRLSILPKCKVPIKLNNACHKIFSWRWDFRGMIVKFGMLALGTQSCSIKSRLYILIIPNHAMLSFQNFPLFLLSMYVSRDLQWKKTNPYTIPAIYRVCMMANISVWFVYPNVTSTSLLVVWFVWLDWAMEILRGGSEGPNTIEGQNITQTIRLTGHSDGLYCVGTSWEECQRWSMSL